MRTTAYGAALGAAALALLALNLGGPGFWEPEELAAADGTLAISPITAAAIRVGIAIAGGTSELAARLPCALLAALALAAVMAAGHIVRGRRGAIAAGIVLVTTPLFVLQARLAGSEIGNIAAGSVAVLGAALVAARRGRSVAGWIALLTGVGLITWATIARAPSPAADWIAALERLLTGAFPWTAAIPLVAGGRPGWAWAAVGAGWIAAATLGSSRALDPVLPALALAIGVGVIDRRPRHPAAAVVALALAVQIGRDLARFPAQLAASAIATPTLAVHAFARALPAVAGVVFGLATLAALWQPRRFGRAGTAIAAASALGFALLLCHHWIPTVSAQRSAKHLYTRWRELDPAGPPPALWRASERAAALYAPGARRAASRDQLAQWLAAADPLHRYAIVAGAEMCGLRAQVVSRGGSLRVFAGDPSSAMLVGGAATAAAREHSPLAGVLEHRPDDARPALADFDGALELIAVDLPRRVGRGDRFDLALTFRVRRTPTRPWQLFVHIERGGSWIKGDHPPIAKLCPPSTWQPGDLVIDRHRMKAGDITNPRGRYQVWIGLFVGGGGSWTNMPVRSGDKDDHDRVLAGTIEID